MKKIFVILAALFMGASAFAANEYDTKISGKVEVTDMCTSTKIAYKLVFDQKGTSRSDSKTYTSTATLVIYPEGKSIAGTFSLADETLDQDKSFIYYSAGSPTDRYFIDYSATKVTSITITDNNDGTYSLSGSLRSNPKSNFFYYYYYAAEDNVFTTVAADPYANEPAAKTEIEWSSSRLEVYGYEGAVPVEMYASNADGSDLDLVFFVDEYDIPAGEYEISASEDTGTILAGDGSEYNPSCFHTAGYADEYYLVGGTLTVSYADGMMTITGAATTGHGSTIKINATGKDPFGHEAVDPLIYSIGATGTYAIVTGIDSALNGTEVVIPATTNIYGKDVDVTMIAEGAFAEMSGIKTLVISENVEAIGAAAFSLCTGLTSIECKAAAAPTAGATAFYKINPAITVTVPSASVDSYKSADGWKMFTNIKGE